MTGIHGFLQQMGGRLHENKRVDFLRVLLTVTARAGCKRRESWFDPSVLPAGCQGRVQHGSKQCRACTRAGRKVPGVWSTCPHHFITQSTQVSGQMCSSHKDVTRSSILPIINHRHNSATWQRCLGLACFFHWRGRTLNGAQKHASNTCLVTNL